MKRKKPAPHISAPGALHHCRLGGSGREEEAGRRRRSSLVHRPPPSHPARFSEKKIHGGRRTRVPAGDEGGAEARRRGRRQEALPRVRGRRVPLPHRHGGRRQSQAAARRGLRLPPHERPTPEGAAILVQHSCGQI